LIQTKQNKQKQPHEMSENINNKMKQFKKNIIAQHIKQTYPATQKEANCTARKTIKTRKWHREKPAKTKVQK